LSSIFLLSSGMLFLNASSCRENSSTGVIASGPTGRALSCATAEIGLAITRDEQSADTKIAAIRFDDRSPQLHKQRLLIASSHSVQARRALGIDRVLSRPAGRSRRLHEASPRRGGGNGSTRPGTGGVPLLVPLIGQIAQRQTPEIHQGADRQYR